MIRNRMENATKKDAVEVRQIIVELCHRLGNAAAHLGGCLSLSEIITVLYCDILKVDIDNPQAPMRDRVIMSKGHGSIAMYAGMYKAGMIGDIDELGDLLGHGNIYYKQEVRNPQKGLEFSSGSLGQGLAYAIGVAWALKRSGNKSSRVYVIVGEGECNEGSVWEAASIASHLKLDNIVVIVDMNGLQIDGKSEEINNQNNMEQRWRSFGFQTCLIDGHDMEAVRNSLTVWHAEKPMSIIAKTTKGKGLSFTENQAEWHQNILTEALYQQAIRELSGI